MFQIKISTNIRPNEQGFRQTTSIKNARIIRQIENTGVRIMRQEAPVRRGSLRRSIRKLESAARQTGDIFRGFVKIGPTVVYTKYVVRRTKPSQGTYVPELDKRIKFGRHPGTASNNFVLRTKIRLQKEAQQIVDNHYGPGRIDIKRFIK